VNPQRKDIFSSVGCQTFTVTLYAPFLNGSIPGNAFYQTLSRLQKKMYNFIFKMVLYVILILAMWYCIWYYISNATNGTYRKEMNLLSKLEKLLEKVRNNPKAVRFEELEKLLLKAEFVKRQSGKGTSHYVYKNPTTGKKISIPFRQPYILETYVKEALVLIGDYFNEDD